LLSHGDHKQPHNIAIINKILSFLNSLTSI